jgi:hypothetical protein
MVPKTIALPFGYTHPLFICCIYKWYITRYCYSFQSYRHHWMLDSTKFWTLTIISWRTIDYYTYWILSTWNSITFYSLWWYSKTMNYIIRSYLHTNWCINRKNKIIIYRLLTKFTKIKRSLIFHKTIKYYRRFIICIFIGKIPLITYRFYCYFCILYFIHHI